MQLALFIMAISVFHFQLTNLVFSLILIFTYTILIIIGLYFRDERKKRLFSYFIENLIIRHHLVCPDWKKMSYKVILSGVLFTIMSSLDLFILKLITPNKNLVGMYSVVWVICRIFSLIGYGIYTIIIPQIDMYTKPNSICSLQTFQKLLNKINKLMLIILIILALISITFGKEILALFSPEYAAVYVVLVICTITSFLTAVSIPAINLLLYSNHINTLMAIEALYLVLMLILGVVLTYYFSIIGISVACLITQSVVTLFQIHYVRKKTHIKSMIII
jgi:O-antigen/teichoic acid export membrane protein